MKFKYFIEEEDFDVYYPDDILEEGAGDASLTTRLQEGVHCVAYAIRQMTKKDINEDDILEPGTFLEAYTKYCKVDTPDSVLFDWIFDNNKWVKSVVASTNACKKSGYLKKNNYKFHRGSPFMSSIYEQAQVLLHQEGVKMGGDKWNPSDIWASMISSVPKFNNIIEYNDWISKNFESGKLVGISLKMVSGSAKVVLSSPKVKHEPLTYGSIKKPRDILPTGITVLTSKKGTGINFRSFRISHQADITGEIIMAGTGARHGKVPSAILHKVIKEFNIPQLEKSRIDKSSDTQLKSSVQNLWKQCGYNFSDDQMENAWEKRKIQIQDRTGYWQSIIHSLEIGAYMNSNKGKSDDIINDFFVGASSASEFSSTFIKVY